MAGQCVYCGSDLRPSSMFCFGCGQLVVRSDTNASKPSAPLGNPPGMPATKPAPHAPTTAPHAVIPPLVTAVPTSSPAHSTGTEVVDKRPTTGANPPQVAAPRATGGPLWLVCGAQRVLVEGEVIVGRRPDTAPGAKSLLLNDTSRTVSRSHVAVRVEGGIVSVTDLGSSNGTWVDREGALIECVAHNPVPIGHGDVIHVGDVAVSVQDS